MQRGGLEEKVEAEMGKLIKFVCTGDWHVPFEDKQSLRNTLNFIYQQRPDYLVLNGDIVDFYAISHFSRDPDRVLKLQEELDGAKEYLKEIRKRLPNTRIVYLIGNHDQRAEKFINEHPELHSLDCLKLENLLGLRELDIELKEEFTYANFLFKHGDFIQRYTAAKELSYEGVSGNSAHTHLQQSHLVSDRGGCKGWWINGHLCDEKQIDYGPRNKNWTQGFSIVHFEPNGHKFHVEQIYIDKKNHSFIYGGRVYGNGKHNEKHRTNKKKR